MARTDAVTRQSQGSDLSYWKTVKHAWLDLQRHGSIRSIVEGHFAGRHIVDRQTYGEALDKGLGEFVLPSLMQDGRFDLSAFEYRSLYPRIMGESPLPESMLFLFHAKDVQDDEFTGVRRAMAEAYGQELTYLTMMPKELPWLQVVFEVGTACKERYEQTVFIRLAGSMPSESETLNRWATGDISTAEREKFRLEIRTAALTGILNARFSDKLGETSFEQLANMISVTPFMTLTRFAQTKAGCRTVLYLPAYLHGDRIGGGVLMGALPESDVERIDALHMATQMMLAHLRLAEFPEEIRRAEKEVLQRQLVRRFRHNLMHPLGNLMDSVRRFKDSFEQILVVFEKGIESWTPDLMPNKIKKFVIETAEDYRSEDEYPPTTASGKAGETEHVRFPIEVVGRERIERFDRAIVAEVLRNLLTNTGRYAVPAPGFLRVVIDVGASDGSPIQYFEEGGPGLPPAIAADPWRLHPRDASLEASSGQGLFMAKKLMQIHGGDLEYNLRTPNEPDGPGFVLWLKSPNSAPPPEPAPSEGSL